MLIDVMAFCKHTVQLCESSNRRTNSCNFSFPARREKSRNARVDDNNDIQCIQQRWNVCFYVRLQVQERELQRVHRRPRQERLLRRRAGRRGLRARAECHLLPRDLLEGWDQSAQSFFLVNRRLSKWKRTTGKNNFIIADHLFWMLRLISGSCCSIIFVIISAEYYI